MYNMYYKLDLQYNIYTLNVSKIENTVCTLYIHDNYNLIHRQLRCQILQ